MTKCLRPECQEPVRARGLCKSDYMSALHLVNNGLTTWEKLEHAGKVMPRGKCGPKSKRVNWLLSK